MNSVSYSNLYSLALQQHSNEVWFTSHYNHGIRPDAYLQGQRAWDNDVFRCADDIWDPVFGRTIPQAQQLLGTILGSNRWRDISLAPNSHQLAFQVVSSSDRRPLRVLTTTSEFTSTSRQLARLREEPGVFVEEVDPSFLISRRDELFDLLRRHPCDVFLFSHVFYDSAQVVRDLGGLVAGLKQFVGQIAVDGYHAVGAFPLQEELAGVSDHVYYLGGSYKYLQAGLGLGFMLLPESCEDRPLYTSWWGDLSNIGKPVHSPVGYGHGGFRFGASTFDLGVLYRLLAIWRVFEDNGVDVSTIHEHVVQLQDAFLMGLDLTSGVALRPEMLTHDLHQPRANFLCFRLPQAGRLVDLLKSCGIRTDHRNDCLRIGFGLYHTASDIDRLLETLRKIGRIGIS